MMTNYTGTAQSIPEDNTPLSMLPFDYDTFFKEKMVNSLYEEMRDTETFRERLLSDTTELGKVITSQFNSLKTTYMVLARNENFTLYFFQLLRNVEGKALTHNALVTVTGSSILSVLEQPLNKQGNVITTFTVMPDLTINIYNARMERIRWGTATIDAAGSVPVKEDKIATYTIDGNGFFSIQSKPMKTDKLNEKWTASYKTEDTESQKTGAIEIEFRPDGTFRYDERHPGESVSYANGTYYYIEQTGEIFVHVESGGYDWVTRQATKTTPPLYWGEVYSNYQFYFKITKRSDSTVTVIEHISNHEGVSNTVIWKENNGAYSLTATDQSMMKERQYTVNSLTESDYFR